MWHQVQEQGYRKGARPPPASQAFARLGVNAGCAIHLVLRISIFGTDFVAAKSPIPLELFFTLEKNVVFLSVNAFLPNPATAVLNLRYAAMR